MIKIALSKGAAHLAKIVAFLVFGVKVPMKRRILAARLTPIPC